jgi:osmotically-inducible protein OsmY
MDPPNSSLLPADIVTAAEERLRSSRYLGLQGVTCTFADGVLTLLGCLTSFHQKQMAQEAVAGIDGVKEIRNLIGVVTMEQRQNCRTQGCPRLQKGEILRP